MDRASVAEVGHRQVVQHQEVAGMELGKHTQQVAVSLLVVVEVERSFESPLASVVLIQIHQRALVQVAVDVAVLYPSLVSLEYVLLMKWLRLD